MDYNMEDTQNSAPGSIQAAKLAGAKKGPDSQTVTKR
jgi:ubiquitin-conjugating enzyme E2 C